MSSHIINQIYKSRKYILEILEENNFNVEDYKNFSMDEIHSMVTNEQLDLLLSNPNKKVYIKYFISKSLKPSTLYELIEDLFNIEEILEKKDDLVIIYKDEPNDSLTSTIKRIWLNDKIYVSIINIARLQFNILKHELVPRHQILNDEEKKVMRERYNITNDKMLPVISYFDPVAIVLGMRPGDICKIERYSKTAIDSVFYRLCDFDVK